MKTCLFHSLNVRDRYLLQINIVMCAVDVLTVLCCVCYAFAISFNLALLGLFLLPTAVPFKVGELVYAKSMNQQYQHNKETAITASLTVQEFKEVGQGPADVGFFAAKWRPALDVCVQRACSAFNMHCCSSR